MSAEPQPTSPLTRMRITYGKTGGMRYVGNLDMNIIWLRTLRRANLPLAYSKGFTPRPRFQLACSLPMGASSHCELMDVWLESAPEVGVMLAALQAAAPPGLTVKSLDQVDLKLPALQMVVRSSEYRICLKSLPEGYDLNAQIQALLAATTLPRIWRKKNYDLRLLIEDLHRIAPDEQGRPRFQVRLAAREGATGRTEELLDALGLALSQALVERCALILA